MFGNITLYDANGLMDEAATEEMQTLMNIDTAKRQRAAQEQIIHDAVYLRDLAKADYVRQIQKLWSRYDDMDNTFSKAQLYLMKNQSENQAYFDVLQDDMRADFFNGNTCFELVSIQSVGLSEYALRINFKFGDTKLYIQIPRRKNLTVDNVDIADGGTFQFAVETSKNNWKILCNNYCIEPIAVAVKKRFNLD